MAFPSVVARTEYALTTADTVMTPTFTQTTGDLVVIFLARNSAQTLGDIGDGFRSLVPATAHRIHVIYKVLDGTEGGNVSVSYLTSSKGCAIAYNIQGHDAVYAPAISGISTGTSTTPNPATATPLAGSVDYLWLAGFAQAGEEADDDTWCTAAPSSFTNLVQKTTGIAGTASTNASLACAERQLNASSLDPGTFTTVQSLSWSAYTVAIYPYVTYQAAYALKTAFRQVYRRIRQFFPLLMQYPPTPEIPGGETAVTPHFFRLPVRRYHKSGRYL